MPPKKPNVDSDFPPEKLELVTKILADHGYEKREIIGKGGFSIIAKVHSVKYNTDFAAKITNSSSSRHKTAKITSQIEENALKQFNHPNIIRLYDSFTEDNFAFLILELMSDKSLNSIIREAPIPIPRLYLMIKQIVSAVQLCHQKGYVHRDIKPHNILIDRYGRPKLADFGMSIPVEHGTKLSNYVGSPQYLPPEIIKKQAYDPYKADVWALGVTIYEMAMGRIQWPKEMELVVTSIMNGGIVVSQDTDPPIAKLVMAMTDMDPYKRPTIDKIANLKFFCVYCQKLCMPKIDIKSNIFNENYNEKRISLAQKSVINMICKRNNGVSISYTRSTSLTSPI